MPNAGRGFSVTWKINSPTSILSCKKGVGGQFFQPCYVFRQELSFQLAASGFHDCLVKKKPKHGLVSVKIYATIRVGLINDSASQRAHQCIQTTSI